MQTRPRVSGAVAAVLESASTALDNCDTRAPASLDVETNPPSVALLLELIVVNLGRPAGPSRARRLRSLLFRLGTVLENEGRSDLAECALRLAVGSSTDGPHVDRARMMVALGRVERRLGRYEEALAGFLEAHAEALATGEFVTAAYAKLGEAKTHILWGDGALAEHLITEVIDATHGKAGEWLLCWRDAIWDLAMLRERQGRMAERTVLLWQTLLAPFPLTDRTKMLGDLALGLRQLGEYAAARDSLALVAGLATHQPIRLNAQIELVHLAADARDDITYHRWRWAVQEALDECTGSQLIDALTAIARSERVFGDPRIAQRFFTMAVEEAMRQGHQWWIERLVRLKRAEPARHAQMRDPSVALVVQGLPAVLDELRRLAG